MRIASTAKTPDGITWYYEQEGSGPHIVLVPDGLGDCYLFDKPMSLIAKEGFTVTTFDTPGLSRSAEAPPEAYRKVSGYKLAKQVMSLIDVLGIDTATFWGCSSGGSCVVAIGALFPDRVRNVMPHEVPTYKMDGILKWAELENDDEISQAMADAVPKMLVGEADMPAWRALGDECLARIYRNFPPWVRGYGPIPQKWSDEELTKRPVDWSVGFYTPTGVFYDNIVTATKLGIDVTVLPGMHFPYVTHPGEMAEYVIKTTKKYL